MHNTEQLTPTTNLPQEKIVGENQIMRKMFYLCLGTGIVAFALGSVMTLLLLSYWKPTEQNRSTIPAPKEEASVQLEIPTQQESSQWIQHSIPTEKISLAYPENWRLEENSALPYADAPAEYMQYSMLLTSPNDFVISIRTGLDGLGGGCTEECQKMNIPNQVLGKLDFYTQPLYVVLNGYKPQGDRAGSVRFNVLPEETCWHNGCYGFAGKNSVGTVIITGEFVSADTQENKYLPPDAFAQSEDVLTAIEILKTLQY